MKGVYGTLGGDGGGRGGGSKGGGDGGGDGGGSRGESGGEGGGSGGSGASGGGDRACRKYVPPVSPKLEQDLVHVACESQPASPARCASVTQPNWRQ